MVERSQNSYPLLRQFREFYAEIARLRAIAEDAGSAGRSSLRTARSAEVASEESRSVLEPGAIPSSPATTVLVDQPAEATAFGKNLDATTIRIWHEMAAYLDQKMYEVRLATSAISHDYLEELVYIMAAFSDETFVCLLDWPGKDYWRDHLMELRLFHTQIAGQDLFRRIEKALVRQDYGVEELAMIYLMVLALGFKGQYLRDPPAVELYRRKLFDRLAMTNPELRRESRRLFPEGYRHTVTEGAPVRLPEPKTWWLIVAGIVGSWLLLSTVAWLALTSTTRHELSVAMKSLDRVVNHEKVAAPMEKWTALPFTLQNGAFRAQLPASVPLAKGASGAVVAPFLVAVDGFGGQPAGSASQVARWLARGATTVTSSANSSPKSQPVVSADQIQTPPGGITATGSTLFFIVDTGFGAQQLGGQPQLSFPVDGRDGISVDAVTLYLPGQPVAAEP